MRDREGLGPWEHRGKVAVVGTGQSHIFRRWDGVAMDHTMGALAIEAVRKAIADAGLSMDDIDGLITSPETRTEQTWAPRPYFPPPYDSEDGLTKVSAEWLQKQMGFKNVRYTKSDAPYIGPMLGLAAQAVGDGLCHTALVWYPMGNLEGRYGHENPDNISEYAKGSRAFALPWGYQSGAMMNNLITFRQYCRKYGKDHSGLGPLAVNLRRNGLMTPYGYYALHEPYQITLEDYANSRPVMAPLVVFDCDRPVMTCGAYIITTAERARDMRQKPVYILNHAQNNLPGRSTMTTLEEQQAAIASLARKMWEGSGLGPEDVDTFNPYDGYLTFTQLFLEGFQWHGVKEGEAHDFYAGDMRVEGPHPFMSSGGNHGTGRNRTAIHTDCIEQLRGTAGARQVRTRCEVAVAGCNTPESCGFTMFSKHPG
jgi:acetyl-CoA acetyltransferase